MQLRRTLLVVPLSVGLLSVGFGLHGLISDQPLASGPDVLLVTICSLRADHVHAYGYPLDNTPAIDALAAAGTRYDNAYAAGTWTGSSHGPMLTGVLPGIHGVIDFGEHVSTILPTLPGVLGLYGYSTAAFQVGGGPATFGSGDGLDRGFGTFATAFQDDAAMAVAAGKWWKAARHPVFALVHVRDAHEPYSRTANGLDPRIEAWRRASFQPGPGGAEARDALAAALPEDAALSAQFSALYDEGVHSADSGLAAVLAAIAPDPAHTVVILAGDHGEDLGEGGHIGHMRYADEAVVHVPLIVDYPPGLREPSSVSTEVSLVDLLPTVLALASAPLPALLDGRSLLGLGDALPWAPDTADSRVRPAFAQMTASAPGRVAPLQTVVLTRDWRLEDPLTVPHLYRRSGTGWEIVDEPAVQAALMRRAVDVSDVNAPATAPSLSEETIRALQRDGYWVTP